jgi:hypothetical protein
MRNFIQSQNICMIKACILAFGSGIFFFFLILQSAWWLLPGVFTWTAIFIWQDRQERRQAEVRELSNSKPDKNPR